MTGDTAAAGERVRVHAVVTGRVQGVWFRESCRREAERLGVAGWVRNDIDGSVEIEAEGEPAAVDALVRWARRGPARAEVTAIAVRDRPVRGESRFRVGR